MTAVSDIQILQKKIVSCNKCTRLVEWRKNIAINKVARYHDWNYWGKPVASWGDENAELLIVGLAPAAHGANRTGRMFTGDQSGKWLYRALYDFGFSNKPTSEKVDDGLELNNCWIAAVIHCAPPHNKPSTEEINKCRTFLLAEIKILKDVKVVLSLGKIAFDTTVATMKELKLVDINEKFKFAHGAELKTKDGKTILASFHPSQQNTFTGRLTKPMFDKVFRRITKILNNQ